VIHCTQSLHFNASSRSKMKLSVSGSTSSTNSTKSNSPNYQRSINEIKIKLLMIGDSFVGKSCLVHRFSRKKFPSDHIATIGIDYQVQTLDVDNRRVKLQLWDTAGMERFRTITNAYYRGAHGIVLVYDVTDETSFFNVRTWMNNIDHHAQSDVCRILIGNKIDIKNERSVSIQRGQEMADDYNVPYFETSALLNQGVDDAMIALIRDVMKCKFPESSPTDVTVDVNSQSNKPPFVSRKKCGCEIL